MSFQRFWGLVEEHIWMVGLLPSSVGHWCSGRGAKEAVLPHHATHLLCRCRDLLEFTEAGFFPYYVSSGSEQETELYRGVAGGCQVCFFGWPSHQEGQERSILDSDPSATDWGVKKLLVHEVGWGVEVAMGNLFGFWQPGPRPDNGSCAVFVFFFLNCSLPTTPLHLWKFGNLLMSCWVQAPEPARTLGESLALAAVMWETGLWPLDSRLHRGSAGS